MTNEQILELNKDLKSHFIALNDGSTDYINNGAGTCRYIRDIETIVAQGKELEQLKAAMQTAVEDVVGLDDHVHLPMSAWIKLTEAFYNPTPPEGE